MATAQRESMKKTFENVQFMSASSDIWSRCNKSFIAVSVHYYEGNKLTSKFIACEHFMGRHTHDRVAEKLNGIFKRFGILEKVFFVTTDGAGEYTAAFRRFGDNYRSIFIEEPSVFSPVVPNSNHGSGSDELNLNEQTVNVDADEDQSECDEPCSDSEEENYYRDDSTSPDTYNDPFHIEDLPDVDVLGGMNRIDCSSHKLDKVGSKDALKANENDEHYKDLYNRVFQKIGDIWKLKESRLNSEIFSRITGRKLVGPHRIRWCKLVEAVSTHF